MTIAKTTTIFDFQNEFMRLYPFLKIEFFRKPHYRGKASVSEDMIFNRTTLLGATDNFKQGGIFEFNSEKSIADVEQKLQDQFGLSTQIFCKIKGEWATTTKTNKLTLAAQNAEGS